MQRLNRNFFTRDVLIVAPQLLGKYIVRRFSDGTTRHYLITETEAYRGEEDKACHARKGKTPRTRVMYGEGGLVYVYLVYGIHWMLNIVTGDENHPQAALIRSIKNIEGPGRVTRHLYIDKAFYGEDLTGSTRLWLEEGIRPPHYTAGPRIGIEYAGDKWKNKPWRFKTDKPD